MRFNTKVVVTLGVGAVVGLGVTVLFPHFVAGAVGGALVGAGTTALKYALSSPS